MKKIILMILLCLMTKAINAQEVNFEIMITDEDRIIEYESGIPVFDNEDITEIFSNYTVTYFAVVLCIIPACHCTICKWETENYAIKTVF